MWAECLAFHKDKDSMNSKLGTPEKFIGGAIDTILVTDLDGTLLDEL